MVHYSFAAAAAFAQCGTNFSSLCYAQRGWKLHCANEEVAPLPRKSCASSLRRCLVVPRSTRLHCTINTSKVAHRLQIPCSSVKNHASSKRHNKFPARRPSHCIDGTGLALFQPPSTQPYIHAESAGKGVISLAHLLEPVVASFPPQKN